MPASINGRLIAALVLLVGSLSMAGIAAAGDAEAGKEKAQVCVACHGETGNGPLTEYPRLDGQYEDYLVQALLDYRSGDRQNAIMAGFASGLSDEDIADLAAWFASQPNGLTDLTIK